MKKLTGGSERNNFWMFHRISFNDGDINNIYKKRGMLHTYNEIISLIDLAYSEGYTFGSIKQALQNKNIIHLTFDDGYKEHLIIAKKLKNKYNFLREHITFSINIRNSFYNEKLAMDLIYQLKENDNLESLNKIFNDTIDFSNIKAIKDEIFKSTKHITALNKLNVDLDNYFLNQTEIKQLTELFSIGSHCVNHCYLTTLTEESVFYELSQSKSFLEEKFKIKVTTICYPDGKNSHQIRTLSKKCGYQYGLSISNAEDDYKIGRTIPCLTSK